MGSAARLGVGPREYTPREGFPKRVVPGGPGGYPLRGTLCICVFDKKALHVSTGFGGRACLIQLRVWKS